VDSTEVALIAKHALDKCIELKKEIALSVHVEKKINVNQLMGMLSVDYLKHIGELEIYIGRFEWPQDEEDDRSQPRENAEEDGANDNNEVPELV